MSLQLLAAAPKMVCRAQVLLTLGGYGSIAFIYNLVRLSPATCSACAHMGVLHPALDRL